MQSSILYHTFTQSHFTEEIQSFDDLHTLLDICEEKVKSVMIQIFVCVVLYSFIDATCVIWWRKCCLYFDSFCLFAFFTITHNKLCYAKCLRFEIVRLVLLKNTFDSSQSQNF